MNIYDRKEFTEYLRMNGEKLIKVISHGSECTIYDTHTTLRQVVGFEVARKDDKAICHTWSGVKAQKHISLKVPFEIFRNEPCCFDMLEIFESDV